MLTDPEQYGGKPEDSFDVIVPSIPGFGFSDHEAIPDANVADLWAKLMTGLGYEHFAAAGGDIGGGVTLALANQYPERVTGVHVTDVGYPTGQEKNLTEAEQRVCPNSFRGGGSRKVLTPCSKPANRRPSRSVSMTLLWVWRLGF